MRLGVWRPGSQPLSPGQLLGTLGALGKSPVLCELQLPHLYIKRVRVDVSFGRKVLYTYWSHTTESRKQMSAIPIHQYFQLYIIVSNKWGTIIRQWCVIGVRKWEKLSGCQHTCVFLHSSFYSFCVQSNCMCEMCACERESEKTKDISILQDLLDMFLKTKTNALLS